MWQDIAYKKLSYVCYLSLVPSAQVISSISHPPRDIGPLLDTSTGVLWLDALEQYVTSFSLAIQSLASGLLLDLKALIELGLFL